MKTDLTNILPLLLGLFLQVFLLVSSASVSRRGSVVTPGGSGHAPLETEMVPHWRNQRSVRTSVTVRNDITNVLTENMRPERRPRLHCRRFCEFGVCQIMYIPGVIERRYCTCLPTYTGRQCHLRVVPEIA